MKKVISIMVVAFIISACSSNILDDVYPMSAVDCPKGTTYKTNPVWADESANSSPGVYRWCEKS